MGNISRQDLNGARTPTDLQRRYGFQKQAEEIEKMKEVFKVDNKLSISSKNPVQNKVITESLNGKVNKEFGKELSSNDFTDEAKEKLESLSNYNDTELKEQIEELQEEIHIHNNKEILDAIKQEDIDNWNKVNAIKYDLSEYKIPELTIINNSCINKNDRVVISVECSVNNITENTMVTLFNLPNELHPNISKNFIVIGQNSNDDFYFGYGCLTQQGKICVKFNNNEITSYIKFSFIYDLESDVL